MARVLVVDGANVVGSRPDGWWKDRAGAAQRLHERLLVADLSFDDVVLVLEGAAKGGVRAGRDGHLRTAHAPGSGDDEIVAQVAAAAGRGDVVTVVTADRMLQSRVTAAGGDIDEPVVAARRALKSAQPVRRYPSSSWPSEVWRESRSSHLCWPSMSASPRRPPSARAGQTTSRSSSTSPAAISDWASRMLPWIPMSPPSPCFRMPTYSSAGVSTKVEFAHSSSGVAEVKTCSACR